MLIFANPIAGKGRSLLLARELAAATEKCGYQLTLIFTPPEASDLPAGPVHAAISIGGDGTLRAVASRLCVPSPRQSLRLEGPFATPPPILVVPTGTANLMRQSLGLPAHSVSASLKLLQDYHVVPRDAALANGELFLIVAGAGLDGQVIHDLAAHRTGPITHLSYILPTVRSVLRWTYPPITVDVDGQRVFGPAPGMAMVGHVKEHGIGFSFLSRADPTDRKMDVIVFPCRTFVEGANLLLATTTGHLADTEGTVYTTARHRVTVHAVGVPIAVQVDGETAGHTPLIVDLYPHQIPFIAPKP